MLLATIGQTYQTGADAWQLFAVWAALGVFWAIASRAALVWLLVLLLVQLAALRYMNMQFTLLDFMFMGFTHGRGVVPIMVAALCLIAWELAWRFAPGLGMQGRVGTRTLSLLILVMATGASLDGVLDHNEGHAALMGFVVLGLLAGYAWAVRRDVPVLGFVLLALDVLLVVTMGRSMDFGNFLSVALLLGLVFVGLAGVIVSVLRKMLPVGNLMGEHPWFLSVIMGISSWIGSLLLLVFLGTVSVSAGAEDLYWLVVGLILMGLSVALIAKSTSIARQQSGLAMSLAGQASFAWGLSQTLGIHHLGDSQVLMVSMVVVYALLFVLINNGAHRFFATLGIWTSLCGLIYTLLGARNGDYFDERFLFMPLLISLLLALAAVVAMCRLKPLRALGSSALYGTLAAVVVSAVFFGFILPGFESSFRVTRGAGDAGLPGGMTPFQMWTLVTSTALAFAAWLVLWPILKGAMRWAALLFLALAVVGLSQSPVLFAGLLFVAVAAPGMLPGSQEAGTKGAKALAVLGVLMGLAGFAYYYYSLAWPLWLKSLVLAGLGLLLLAARRFGLSRMGQGAQAAAPPAAACAVAAPLAGSLAAKPVFAGSTAILVALALSVVAGGFGIFSKEQIIRNGQHVFLQLRPVDPRSLMQGDYMALGFVVTDDIELNLSSRREQVGKSQDRDQEPVAQRHDVFVRDGVVQLVLDERRVASLVDKPERPDPEQVAEVAVEAGRSPAVDKEQLAAVAKARQEREAARSRRAQDIASGKLQVIRLRYQNGPAGVQISTNAWFFQEGQAERFQGARYGEFVVDASGQALLIGMRDKDLKPL